MLTYLQHRVMSVCFSADRKFIASGSRDKTVKIWSVGSSGTFECQSTLAVDSGEYGVLSVSFSPKDNVIAAGCYNGKIHLVDAVAGEVKSTLRGHSHDNPECTCTFDDDGDLEEINPECPVTGHTRYVPVPALLVLKIVCSLSSDAQFCPWRLLRQDGQEAGFVQRGPNYHGVGRDNRGAHWLAPGRALPLVSLLPVFELFIPSCRTR